MKTTQDYNTTIVVNESPKEVFDAINNVHGWWSENIVGGTKKLNDEFSYKYKDAHHCTMKLIEVISDQKVVWLVLDNYFNFLQDQNEWKGNKIIFEISKKGNQTQMHFMHEGLTPAYECYPICFDAWTGYIQNSLYNLITTGKGTPNPKE